MSDRRRADGVSCEDPLEAAVACEACRRYHSRALLSMRLANAPAPRIVDAGQWVDPPIQKPDGGTIEPEGSDDGN